MRDQRGYTLVEVLMAMAMLAIISSGFYLVMFSGTRSSRATRELAEVSEEARLGFNRMMRDTREADSISSYSATTYTISIDFDDDGTYEVPNTDGDYEILTYAFDATTGSVTITAGGAGTQTLMQGVEAVPGQDVFSYSSNHLEYDWDADGITTLTELQNAGTFGVSLTSSEIDALISSVNFSLRVKNDDCASSASSDCARTVFYGQAQLRNRR